MKLREENAAIRRMWEEDKKHYEISKENMELISIKAHDLKHKILSYSSSLPEEELAQMKKTIDEYDNFFHTGNDAIDVILSEKGMRCEKEKIALTFLGDGKILSFMNAMDIYSLLGNAIDNSIEALKHVEEVEKRIISINLENKGDITNLTIRNYFDGELQLDEDGLPFTSKQFEKGYHGYGMKSMRLIARKYSGNLSIRISGNIFVVNIYLMR
jgi:sensor histidine kinase regulating citrate/malate metabolism